MVTENNSQINTFIKGMDSDTSYQMLNEQSYILAKNLRLLSLGDNDQHGELTVIPGIQRIDLGVEEKIDKILATDYIRNYGIIITYSKYPDSAYWSLYRIMLDTNETKRLFRVKVDLDQEIDKFDTLFKYEDDKNVKLYIADQVDPIICINISDDDYIKTLVDKNDYVNTDKIKSYPSVSYNTPEFLGFTSGRLKPGLVQYSYRLYKKHGVYADVSPATKLIPIIKYDKNNIKSGTYGYLQSENSNSGVNLKITIDNSNSHFDRIMIYRIQYIENGQLPTIETIYDEEIRQTGEMYFTDAGQSSIETITLEEYNSFTGIHFIPKTIETKDDYLFAANIHEIDKDKDILDWDARAYSFNSEGKAYLYSYFDQTGYEYCLSEDGDWFDKVRKEADCYNIYNSVIGTIDQTKEGADCKYKHGSEEYGGTGPNVEWEFKVGSSEEDITVNKPYITPGTKSYYDPEFSYKRRSLRRGELYRYGIILYNKYGESSGVKWIADIKVPDMTEDGFHTFEYVGNQLKTRHIGVKFTISNLPESVTSYEIVRCNRTVSDIKNITQGIISRPVARYNVAGKAQWDLLEPEYPYTPTGYFTVAPMWYGDSADFTDTVWWSNIYYQPLMNKINLERNTYSSTNLTNKYFYQFASPEVCYLKDSLNNQLDKSNINIKSLLYLYSSFGGNSFTKDNFDDNKRIAPSYTNLDLFIQGNKHPNQDNNLVMFYNDKTPFIWYNTKVLHKNQIFQYGYVTTDGEEKTYTEKKDLQDVTSGKDYLKLPEWPTIKKYMYNYIKLYNSTQDVTLAFDNDPQTLGFTQHTASEEYKIKAYSFAQDSKWDGFISKTGDKIYDKKYKENSAVCGNYEFCNYVMGSTYDAPIDEIITEDHANYMGNGGKEDTMFGAGGRTMLIQLDSSKDNIFWKTHGKSSAIDVSNFGTYLCNITQEILPYGGSSNQARKTNVYYGDGDYVNVKNGQVETTIEVYNGDCYIMPFEYISMHKIYCPYDKGTLPSNTCIYSIPVETNINLAYTSGYEWSKNITSGDLLKTNIQIEPSSVYGLFTQDRPLYSYNTAYSSNDKTKLFAPETQEDYEEQLDTDCRIYHSNVKSNNEYIDSWLKFQSNDYLDVNTQYGQITNIKTFKNNLYLWQENALAMLSVNERTAVSTDNNMPLIIGQSGVLSRYDYIDQNSGMRKNEFVTANSSDLLYYFDHDNNSIKAINGSQVVDIVKLKSVQNIMNRNKSDDKQPYMFYDTKYNEVVSNVLENNSIVYNDKLQAFTSLYDIEAEGDLRYKDKIILVTSGNELKAGYWNEGEHNDIDEDILKIYLQYVVNKVPYQTKVFDNQELVSSNPIDYAFEELKYSFKTELNETSKQQLQMTNREGNLRYAIPRSLNGERLQYGERLRGKYVICTIEGEAVDDISLSYVITKFRGSLS